MTSFVEVRSVKGGAFQGPAFKLIVTVALGLPLPGLADCTYPFGAPGTSAEPARLPVSLETSGSQAPTAIFVGGERFELVRDHASGQIAGVIDRTGQVLNVDQRPLPSDFAVAQVLGPLVSSHALTPPPTASNTPRTQRCKDWGGSPYSLGFATTLGTVFVHATRDQGVSSPFWQSTLPAVYGSGGDGSGSGNGGSQEARLKRCQDEANACLAKAGSSYDMAKDSCLAAGGVVAGRSGSAALGALIAAACVGAADYFRTWRQDRCFGQLAACAGS